MIPVQAAKFDNVMIIDDTEIDIYITSKIISNNNFGGNILKFSEATLALKYLQDNQENLPLLPEVILVDIYMPIMTGFEFMDAYDKLPATLKNHCKAFIISSTGDVRDITRAGNDKNVVAFQEKPITNEFLSKIAP
ncbi:MAG: response regulator [Bacteroidota bacterium]|nr:response regulator [Bacteroidota bacterium]